MIKVRIKETEHKDKYVCWLDAGISYYYGRSYVDQANVTPDMINKEVDIETYLKTNHADYIKSHSVGCLPEWSISFKTPKDFTGFLLKHVDMP